MHLILHRDFKWNALSRRVRREQRNREKYSPTISTYRWWARRSHALIGELLDQGRKVLGNDIIVSDPMAGGGTVAIEAARRGLVVHAQDVNPWAAFGLRTTLQPVDTEMLERAAEALIKQVERQSKKLYHVGAEEELINRLHVRSCTCTKCQKSNYLFPTRLIALDNRIVSKPHTGWFGCPACGAVQRDKWPEGPNECESCGHTFTDKPDAKLIENLVMTCAHCSENIFLNSKTLQTATWQHVFSVTTKGRKLEMNAPDKRLCQLDQPSQIARRMNWSIPKTGETAALWRGGFTKWSELFPDCQMALLD